MSEDARFEDGEEKALNIGAFDISDLEIISSLIQDSILPASEIQWLPNSNKLAFLVNRFRWEDKDIELSQDKTGERVQSLLMISHVKSVSSSGFYPKQKDKVLAMKLFYNLKRMKVRTKFALGGGSDYDHTTTENVTSGPSSNSTHNNSTEPRSKLFTFVSFAVDSNSKYTMNSVYGGTFTAIYNGAINDENNFFGYALGFGDRVGTTDAFNKVPFINYSDGGGVGSITFSGGLVGAVENSPSDTTTSKGKAEYVTFDGFNFMFAGSILSSSQTVSQTYSASSNKIIYTGDGSPSGSEISVEYGFGGSNFFDFHTYS